MTCLYDLYDEDSVHELVDYEHRIKLALRCPCHGKYICMHDILPPLKPVGGSWCVDNCPYSEIWQRMKNNIVKILEKEIWGI